MHTTAQVVPSCLADVPALILAGGLGTRLRPALPDLPKVLAPIGRRPFLAYVLDRLAAAKFRRVVLLTGYGADAVERSFGARFGPLALTYSRETVPLGTGGAVRQALDLLDGTTVLLLNGDSCCDVDLQAFFARHRQGCAALSMVVARVEDASRYGQVRMNDADRIVGFVEKAAAAGPGWINAGVYLLQRELIEELPAAAPTSLERGWLQHWVATRKTLGFRCAGAFLDIGTPASYAAAPSYFTEPR